MTDADAAHLMYIPLARRSAETGGGAVPLRKLVRNLGVECGEEERALSAAYWSGWPASAEELAAAVGGGQLVGVLPERCGLCVVDCDVRGVWSEVDGVANFKLRYGVDDLVRTGKDEEREHDAGWEVTPTLAVATPSGGTHLYYWQNPSCRLDRNRGHGPDWRVDLKCSANSWAVAPPSPGYEVVKALPIAVMSYAMARWFKDLHRRRPLPKDWRGGSGEGEVSRGGILTFVEASAGVTGMGWNGRLFWAACRYGETGAGIEETMDELLGAARPWNDGERARAVRTIESGWRRGKADAE